MGDELGGLKNAAAVVNPTFPAGVSGWPFAAQKPGTPIQSDSYIDKIVFPKNYDCSKAGQSGSFSADMANKFDCVSQKLETAESLVDTVSKNGKDQVAQFVEQKKKDLEGKTLTKSEIRLSLYNTRSKINEINEASAKKIQNIYEGVLPEVESLWTDAVSHPYIISYDTRYNLTLVLLDLKVKAAGTNKDEIESLKSQKEYFKEEVDRLGKKWDLIMNRVIPYRCDDDMEIASHNGELPDRATYKEWQKMADDAGALATEYESKIAEIEAILPEKEKRYAKLLQEIPQIIEYGIVKDYPVQLAQADGPYGYVIPAQFGGGEDDPAKKELEGAVLKAAIYGKLGELGLADQELASGIDLAQQAQEGDAGKAMKIALLLQRDEYSYVNSSVSPVNLTWINEAETLLDALPVDSSYYELRTHILLRKAHYYKRMGGEEGITEAKNILSKLKGRIRDILFTKYVNGSLSPAKFPEWVNIVGSNVSPTFSYGPEFTIARLILGGVKTEHEVTTSEAMYLYKAGVFASAIEAKEAGYYFAEDEEDEFKTRIESIVSTTLMLELSFSDLAEAKETKNAAATDISVQAEFQELIAQGRAGVGHVFAACGLYKDALDIIKDHIQKPYSETITSDELRNYNGFLAQMNPNLLDPVEGYVVENYEQDEVAAGIKTASRYLHSDFLGRRGAMDLGGAGGGALVGMGICGPECAAVGAFVGALVGETGDTVWSVVEKGDYISQSYATGISPISTAGAATNIGIWGLEYFLFYKFARWAGPKVQPIVPAMKEIGGGMAHGFANAYKFWTSPLKNLSVLYDSMKAQAFILRYGTAKPISEIFSGTVQAIKNIPAVLRNSLASRYATTEVGAETAGVLGGVNLAKVVYDAASVMSYSWYLSGAVEKVVSNWSGKEVDYTNFSKPYEWAMGGLFVFNMVRIANMLKPVMKAVAFAHSLSSFLKEGIRQVKSGQSLIDMDPHRICTSAMVVTFASYLGNEVTQGMKVTPGWRSITASTLTMVFSTFPMTFLLQPLYDADTEYYYKNRLYRHPTTDILRKAIRFGCGWNNFYCVMFDDLAVSIGEEWLWTNLYPPYAGKKLWVEELPEHLKKGDFGKLTKFFKNKFSTGIIETELEPKDLISLREVLDDGVYGEGFYKNITPYLEYLEKSTDIFEQRLYHGLSLVVATSNNLSEDSKLGKYFRAHPYIFSTFNLNISETIPKIEKDLLEDYISGISAGKYDKLFKMENGVYKKRRKKPTVKNVIEL